MLVNLHTGVDRRTCLMAFDSIQLRIKEMSPEARALRSCTIPESAVSLAWRCAMCRLHKSYVFDFHPPKERSLHTHAHT